MVGGYGEEQDIPELENLLQGEEGSPEQNQAFMLEELQKVEQEFTQNLQNLSKEKFIEIIEQEYQTFCTEARVIFEQRMSEILTYEDIDNHSEAVKS